jgi:hypothetical protein
MGLAERFREAILSDRDGGESAREYTLERMSFRGGWKLTGARWGESDDPPLDRPSSDEQVREVDGPGRYRLVERVDGPISEVVWSYETVGAEAHYAEKRAEVDSADGDGESESDGLGDLERSIVTEIREEEGPVAALEAYKDVMYPDRDS